MKLNEDCIRDLLLYLEDMLDYDNPTKIYSLELKEYTTEELTYTAERLLEGGLINCSVNPLDGGMPYIVVNSITYAGHQFLDNIRDNKVWKKTKEILSKFESVSVDIISETAAKVIISYLNQV